MAAPTVADSGTKLADGTEQTLYTTASTGYYSSSVDLSNMVSGDTVEIRIYKKTLTGSGLNQIDIYTFSDNQTNDVFFIPFISCPFGFKITLTQTAGTNRNFDWSVETP